MPWVYALTNSRPKRKGDEHPTFTPSRVWHTLPLPYSVPCVDRCAWYVCKNSKSAHNNRLHASIAAVIALNPSIGGDVHWFVGRRLHIDTFWTGWWSNLSLLPSLYLQRDVCCNFAVDVTTLPVALLILLLLLLLQKKKEWSTLKCESRVIDLSHFANAHEDE